MKEELRKKLNDYHNFHLSFKVIQATSKSLIDKLESKINNSISIVDTNNLFDRLKDAYDKKIEYLIINDKIDVLLPLVVCITIDNVNLVKPPIPVFFIQKDNKLAQKIITRCHQKNVSFKRFKDEESLIKGVEEWIF